MYLVHWGPHHSVQADVFFGQNAASFWYSFLSNSHQFAVTDACVTCHMVATSRYWYCKQR